MKDYTIDATGDACWGDEVCFEKNIFKGSYKNPKYVGKEIIVGKIINDNYGLKKQQHTFTILKDDGEKIIIKGRNLYRNGVYRKQWANENDRNTILNNKHTRGDIARAARNRRKNNHVPDELF